MPIFNFLLWHYALALKALLGFWGNLILFSLHLFSVPLLIRTLFYPWHRIYVKNKIPGFSLQKLFYSLSLNLISRIIGFLVRTVLIASGFLWALILFVFGFLLVFVWFFIPFFSWAIYLWLNPGKKSEEDLIKGEAKNFVLKRLGISSLENLKHFSQVDVKQVLYWYLKLKNRKINKRKFWKKEFLFSIPALGTDLAFGFTPELNKFCDDLSQEPPFPFELIGRDKEISMIATVLNRRHQSHALVLGEPGVGKHAILMGLAKAIKEKRINAKLFYHRVLLLRMTEVLGSANSPELVKKKLLELFKEAKSAGNVILVIKNIEKYVSKSGGSDLSVVFSQVAHSSKLKLLTISTPNDFERFILPNDLFMKFFEKVEVKAATPKEAMDLLQKITPQFEKGKKVTVTYGALLRIIEQSEKLISDIPFPEKAVDLLDQVINQVLSLSKELVNKKDVDKVVSAKLKIPVGGLSSSEKEKLINLKKLLSTKIVGQSQAINSLNSALQRSRLGIAETNKPMGVFLFLGPTGVGKTATAKALAQAYFGDQKQLIRFDMAEFQGKNGLAGLIGSSASNKPGLLIQAVREKPYGVLLLDEFEKAPKEIVNLFLTVFDEGYLKDFNRKNVSFKNLIIICTSNAVGEFIRQTLTSKTPPNSEEFQNLVIDHCLSLGIFSPELINRFDAAIIYHPLSSEQVKVIAGMFLQDLSLRMKSKGIIISFDNSIYDYLVKKGYDLVFGARPLKRLVAEEIESLLAKKMLDNELTKGSKAKVILDNNEVKLLLDQ